MISVGVDVNQAKNDDGSTPLHIACHKGHIEVVATLLAENADVNRVAFGGITPLYAACHNGHIEVVATLLAENADVNKADNDGDTPLYAACGNGRAEVVATLLAENADVNQAANDGTTPLYAACGGNGRAEVVTALLAENADVNQAANDGTTPLYAACGGNGRAEVVTALLAENADVNQAANDGTTPLYAACGGNGRAEVVTALLAENADVNKADNEGNTPLYVACENGDLGVVQLLSSYGASRIFTDTDANLLEAPYDTAEHLAIEQGHHETAAWLVTSRHWSLLHYLEFITTERALELLRDGVGTDAAAPGDPTPLDRAKELCRSGAADAGSAAHVVLEWGAPWKQETHTFYPPAVRARRVALMWIAQSIRRGKAWYEVKFSEASYEALPAAFADVFEICVIPHLISSEAWR